MRLVPYDKNNIKPFYNKYKSGKNQAIIEEFVGGDMDCVKIEGWTHKTPYSCQNAFAKAIKTLNMINTVKCTVANGEVFLIRIDKE